MANNFYQEPDGENVEQEIDEYFQGLGWFVIHRADGTHQLEHNGGGPGFATEMRIYPEEGLGMVIMANGTYLPGRDILDRFASLDW